MASQLTGLTFEILHLILQSVGVTDLASVSQSCKFLHKCVSHDWMLWKIHYLRLFDYPISADKPGCEFWKTRLCEIIASQKVLESRDAGVKERSLKQVTSTALRLLADSPAETSSSLNIPFLAQFFVDRPCNTSHFMSRSSIFKQAGMCDMGPAPTAAERQLSAQLHCYYGVSIEPSEDDIEEKRANAIHPYARSLVYDLRRYTLDNFWGPFLDDGSQGVDWERVEAIMVVLGYNLRVLHERTDGQFSLVWDKPFSGLTQDSLMAKLSADLKDQPAPPPEVEDPYGVTGTWMRIVCFLDYNNLFSFNFEGDRIPIDQEREPIATEEATRLIFLKLRVVKVELPGQDDSPDMPVVHFTGSSRSMHMSWDPNANSKIRGTVRTTPTGTIRWTSFSIYHGEERWRSEGVQIGGRRSARGILGTWFDKDYDYHGPAGPTAFWKLSNEIMEERPVQPYPFTFAIFSY